MQRPVRWSLTVELQWLSSLYLTLPEIFPTQKNRSSADDCGYTLSCNQSVFEVDAKFFSQTSLNPFKSRSCLQPVHTSKASKGKAVCPHSEQGSLSKQQLTPVSPKCCCLLSVRPVWKQLHRCVTRSGRASNNIKILVVTHKDGTNPNPKFPLMSVTL